MAFSSTDLDGILATLGTNIAKGTTTLRAIWRNRYEAVQLADGSIESAGPYVLVKSSDVTANSIAHATQLTIGGANYTVIEIQPDGQGLTRLVLEKS